MINHFQIVINHFDEEIYNLLIAMEKDFERLRALREDLGLKQYELPVMAGEIPANYNAMEAGRRPISKKIVKLLEDKYSISADWLKNGKGDKFLKERDISKNDRAFQKAQEPRGQYGQQLQKNPSGNIVYMGEFVEAGPEKGYQDVDYNDLQRYSLPGLEHKMYFLYDIRGDSMAGRFPSGDQIIVKPVSHRHYIEWGHPYVIKLKDGEGQLFKRIFKSKETPGWWTLRSDNKKYEDIEINPDWVFQVLRFERQIGSNGGQVSFVPEDEDNTIRINTLEQNQNRVLDEMRRLTAQLSKLNANRGS